MKRKHLHSATGFTVAELLVSVAAGAFVLAAVTLASVALQKSFSAADNFLGTQMQQIRIVDYLSRDVRRSYIVTASSDLKIPQRQRAIDANSQDDPNRHRCQLSEQQDRN